MKKTLDEFCNEYGIELEEIEPNKKYYSDGTVKYRRTKNGVEEYYTKEGWLSKRVTNGVKGEGPNIRYEYNVEGKITKKKNLDSGKFEKYKYDDKGRVIYYKDNNTEEKREYNNRGQLIHYKDLVNNIEKWVLEEGELVKRDGNYYLDGNLLKEVNNG